MRRHVAHLAALASLVAFLLAPTPRGEGRTAPWGFFRTSAQHPQHELANRNDWQRPHEVMDVLGVRTGSEVADIGAGSGYFTLHLAGRVGWSGSVYAVDIMQEKLEAIRGLARALNLPQIKTVLGDADNPHLPAVALDLVLVVNSYHEMPAFDAMMQAFHRGLKPGGLLAIIDAAAAPGAPRSEYFLRHELPSELVRADALRSGFRFVREEPEFINPNDGAHWYFLVFQRPATAAPLASGSGRPR
jgi:predicted methyltransferase